MHRSVTILGKVGNMVWGKNRHGQTYYPLVIPINPRTPAQQANRHGFGDASQGWRKLTDSHYALWDADARHYRTHGRPVSRPARLTGFQRYMSVNAKRARQGLPPVAEPPADLPLAHPPAPPLALSLERLPFGFRPLAFSLQPFPGLRCLTGASPVPHRCTTLAPPLHPAAACLAPPSTPGPAPARPF